MRAALAGVSPPWHAIVGRTSRHVIEQPRRHASYTLAHSRALPRGVLERGFADRSGVSILDHHADVRYAALVGCLLLFDSYPASLLILIFFFKESGTPRILPFSPTRPSSD